MAYNPSSPTYSLWPGPKCFINLGFSFLTSKTVIVINNPPESSWALKPFASNKEKEFLSSHMTKALSPLKWPQSGPQNALLSQSLLALAGRVLNFCMGNLFLNQGYFILQFLSWKFLLDIFYVTHPKKCQNNHSNSQYLHNSYVGARHCSKHFKCI